MELTDSLNKINSNNFTVEIFGLGYVGFPLAVKLANEGLKIIGIDVNENRIHRLKNAELMDSELYLKYEFLQCRKEKSLSLSTKPEKSNEPKIGIICVPTPIPSENKKSDTYVKNAVELFLENSKKGDLVILESSIEVGTTENIKELIESKNFAVGSDFGLCFCPERIDPANKEWGIENIPRIIYCSDDQSFEVTKKIYNHVNNGNLIRVKSPKIAEVVKSFENAFRLVNISLVNELAILCDKLGISVKDVIDAASTKPFGFMPHYPGAGAGGHCIPKDPRFLLESAKKTNANFSTIENALKTNLLMPTYIANSIVNSLEKMKKEKIVLIWGLSYKANVEDMRDSPSFKLATELKNKNVKVLAYDPLFNKDFLEKYLIENNLEKLNFELIEELTEESIKTINCVCVIQHHTQVENKLIEIYNNSKIPLIYDSQSKLKKNPNSTTTLDYLGS